MKQIIASALLIYSLSLSSLAQDNTILSGFVTMTVPRESISIGSQWIDGQGPLDQGLSSENLFSAKSVSNYEFQQNKELSAVIKLKFLEYFGINLSSQRAKNTDFIINQAEIVRVKNFSSLNFPSGKTFIFEGIKVSSLSLSTTRKKADSLAIAIRESNSGLEITPNAKNDNEVKLILSGLNLFIAYRLVKFGELKVKETQRAVVTTKIRKHSEVTITHKSDENDIVVTHKQGGNKYLILDKSKGMGVINTKLLGFKIGKEYEGKIYTQLDYNNITRNENTTSFTRLNNIDGCKLILWISSYNEIINGKSKSLIASLNCNNGNEEDYKLTLDSRILNNLFVIDELSISTKYEDASIDKDFFPVDNNFIHTQFRFKRMSIPITNHRGSAPGW